MGRTIVSSVEGPLAAAVAPGGIVVAGAEAGAWRDALAGRFARAGRPTAFLDPRRAGPGSFRATAGAIEEAAAGWPEGVAHLVCCVDAALDADWRGPWAEHFALQAIGAAAPYLHDTGGSVVLLAAPGSPAAEAGLERFVAVTARDLGDLGIRVNGVRCAYVLDEPLPAARRSELCAGAAEASVLRRPVHPAEVAEAVAFLASPAAAAITGQVLWVDAGAHLLAR